MKYATQSTIIKKRIYFIKYCGTYKIRLQIVRAQIYIFLYTILCCSYLQILVRGRFTCFYRENWKQYNKYAIINLF